jgi:hypothetical protein
MVVTLAGDLRDLVTELRQTITQAQAEPEPDRMPLSISGFGDLRYGQTGRHFETGQVEIDLEAAVSERLGLDLAIALEDEGFQLGVFTVDFPL